MKNIRIIDKLYGGCLREPDPDNRWDSGHYFTEHNITGFKVGGKYGDLEVDFTPKKNTSYHLLYITYDTGDSFGRSDGHIEFVDLYQDFEVAEANQKRLLDHYNKWENDHSCSDKKWSTKLVAENKNEYKYSVPGLGYFDNYVTVHLETLYKKVR